jgi:FkbM family methyltransferase
LGIGFYFFVRYRNTRATKLFATSFLGKSIESTSPFWLLHSIDELFLQEIYRFNSANDVPYIIDCGANWGLSCIYFKRRFPQARIAAFEPDPDVFGILSRNLQHFGYTDIELHQKAVWKEKATLKFNNVGALGGSLANGSAAGTTTKSIEVQATDLRFLLHEKVDLLKIDIEGAEFDALEAIKDCLHYVDKIFIEYHSVPHQEQHLPELLQILKEAGFKLYMMEAWKNRTHPFVGNDKENGFDLQLNLFGYR